MPDFGGDGGSSKTVQSTAPWAPVQQPLQDVIAKAGQLYHSGALTPKVPDFAATADFTPEQLQAQAMGTARAVNGSPLNAAAADYLGRVLGGHYLDSNPYNATLAARAGSTITDQLSRAGRYGSNQATARGLAEGLAPVLNQNYQTERGYQQQAASYAPQLASQDYVDINALNEIGQQRQSQAQALLNEAVQRFNTTSTADQNALATYLGFLSGQGGQTQTTKTPNLGPSTLQQGVGAGISLLGALASLWGR
ncbi:MAG TPA: hypothetical protein VHA10_09275 [Hypericibacter adhaerens]|jgi:hypothetical protein|uniref:Uncharacterized protein n=1 Tax=Hypericibacter adhaerens TaxID=2602016 RepID=A0A5J6N1Q1_9PROT|nr:hypothetical protein [Hypericibacter adhaerens]QEX23769.1 hypothetical protein FRZ61_37080 [Hypericibacter adhaerens]HWA43387.1 hypothetical protein [Hypericibacter adhaerens]